MKQIKITILEKDLRNADYCEPMDCPIARAINRIGSNANISIMNGDFDLKEDKYDIMNPRKVSIKVHNIMYKTKKYKSFNAILKIKKIKNLTSKT